MQLDVPSLMVMGSFVAACSGVILLVGWWANRNTSALALWGIASLLSSAGILGLALGPVLREPSFLIIGGNLLALSSGMVWKGTRSIDAKPTPLVLVPFGMAILILAGINPGTRAMTASLGLAINAVYLFAAAISLWLGRDEGLPARRPIIVFLVVHAALMLIGLHFTLSALGLLEQVPPLISFFGVIHFETIVFSVGTAVFLLTLVKERGEAASAIAASIDSLTGIANRAAFMDRAGKAVQRCHEDNVPVSVIMFDLDGFKAINDTFGHAVGDAVIRKFCEVTATALRPTDIFGRLGGEEFAAILPRSSIEAAFIRAERIRAAYAVECRIVGTHQVNATVSGGVSVGVDAETGLSKLLEISDEALYCAKGAGRNRIRRAGQLGLEGGSSTVIRVA